ncbi:hypothetical protein N9J58_00110 [bacterium]|nr:hypothetical protein [bacterium]
MKFSFLALNEVNFDLLAEYEKNNSLKGFKLLRKLREYTTSNDVPYEYLEPWIQWVSVHTGLRAEEHNVFRLGDPKAREYEQIFEVLDKRGYDICAISPMNAHNKISENQCFIPDPWTETRSDASFWSRRLADVLRQTVNDNSSGKISKKSYIFLFLAFLRFIKISWYPTMFQLIYKSLEHKWCKALVLDVLLYNIFLSLRKDATQSFNYLFLNGFAHIQHHYLLNSPYVDSLGKNPSWYISEECDPLKDAVLVYNKILFDFLKRFSDQSVLISTGLSQIPYKDAKFYYRLRDHEDFLNSISINFQKVRRGMTRDFYIDFASNNDRDDALSILKGIRLNGSNFFGDFSTLEKSLFCSLVYPEEISNSDEIVVKNLKIKLLNHVNFVAIKNGMHSDKGYLFTNDRDAFENDNISLTNINGYIQRRSK